MSGWTPPASGTPCWLNIPVKDVQRAKKFYSSTFDWTFEESMNSDQYPPENIAFFHPPDRKSSPGGALSKTESTQPGQFATPNKGDAMMYLYVDNLDGYMKKIVEAGGKQGSDIIHEGMGRMQHFEDTEGNYFGIYAS